MNPLWAKILVKKKGSMGIEPPTLGVSIYYEAWSTRNVTNVIMGQIYLYKNAVKVSLATTMLCWHKICRKSLRKGEM